MNEAGRDVLVVLYELVGVDSEPVVGGAGGGAGVRLAVGVVLLVAVRLGGGCETSPLLVTKMSGARTAAVKMSFHSLLVLMVMRF